jgi:tight adherence protein C
MQSVDISAHAELAPLLIAGAAMLILMGATLLGYSVQIRNNELARRVNLVTPRSASEGARPEIDESPVRGSTLLHGTAGSMSERDQRTIIRKLSALRIPTEYASTAFLFIRFTFIALQGFAAYTLASRMALFEGRSVLLFLLTVVFAIAGWFMPAIIVGIMARSHAKTAAAGLPEAMELLVVCVEAGLALEDGIDRMVIELRHSNPELAEEFALTSADLKILPSRDVALMNLAERMDVPSVRSVVTTLSQTMRYGTPLAQAMRVVAAEMRNDSLLALEERANRLPTLLTLPMMLFIMPTIFLIVGGPAALRVIDTFLH